VTLVAADAGSIGFGTAVGYVTSDFFFLSMLQNVVLFTNSAGSMTGICCCHPCFFFISHQIIAIVKKKKKEIKIICRSVWFPNIHSFFLRQLLRFNVFLVLFVGCHFVLFFELMTTDLN
jgi:hypothetical protein